MADPSAAFSLQSTIGDKISSLQISDRVSAGVDKVSAAWGSVKGSALSIGTKFSSKLAPPVPALPSTTPAATKQSVSIARGFQGTATFPDGMKYYTKFSFYKFDKQGVTETEKKQPTTTIILPLPKDLHETFGVTYDTPSLGPVGGAIVDGALSAIRNRSAGELIPGAGAVADAAEAALFNQMKKGNAALLGQIGQFATGQAPNPNMAVLFSNIGLRTHNFSYKFAPASETELKILKQIIFSLKQRMLPGLTGDSKSLYTFPDMCDIQFGPTKNKPYKIKTCVMENITVNYTPMGSPAFFKTGDPVMVEVSMTFKEMSAFTREDMEDDEVAKEVEMLNKNVAPTVPRTPST